MYEAYAMCWSTKVVCVLSRLAVSDSATSGSYIHGILQARILEWVAVSSSRGSSWPRDQTHFLCVSCIPGRFFIVEQLGKPNIKITHLYWTYVCVQLLQSCLILCDPMDCSPWLLCPWDSPGKNTRVGCCFLLQGIFLTQGPNLHLLHLLHYQADSFYC